MTSNGKMNLTFMNVFQGVGRNGAWGNHLQTNLSTAKDTIYLRGVPYMSSRIEHPPCGDVHYDGESDCNWMWNLGVMVQDGPPFNMINFCCRLKNNEVEVCQNRLDGSMALIGSYHLIRHLSKCGEHQSTTGHQILVLLAQRCLFIALPLGS